MRVLVIGASNIMNLKSVISVQMSRFVLVVVFLQNFFGMQVVPATCRTILDEMTTVDEVSRRHFLSGHWLGIDPELTVERISMDSLESMAECGIPIPHGEQFAPVVSRVELVYYSCSLLFLMADPHHRCWRVVQSASGDYYCFPQSNRQPKAIDRNSTLEYLNMWIKDDIWTSDTSVAKFKQTAQEAIMMISDDSPLVFIDDVFDIKAYADIARSDNSWSFSNHSSNIRHILGSPVLRDMSSLQAMGNVDVGLAYDTLAFCLLANIKNTIVINEDASTTDVVQYTWTPSGGRLYEWRIQFSNREIISISQHPIVRKFGLYFSDQFFSE